MKTIKNISVRVLAIAALALVFAMPAKAQLSDNGYANIDWQFNVPLSNGFADDAAFTKLCDEARKYNFKMVAINPAQTVRCKEKLKDSLVHVGAAIGFPLGLTTIQ